MAGTIKWSATAWNGKELVQVEGDHLEADRWVVNNEARAYSPTSGTWRELGDLPSPEPLVALDLVASKFGIVLGGIRCSDTSPGFQDRTAEDLECSPGTATMAVLSPEGDRFEPISDPVLDSAEGGIDLIASAASDSVLVRLDNRKKSTYEWTPTGGFRLADVGVATCFVGDALYSIADADADDVSDSGTLQVVRLRRPGGEWQTVRIPAASTISITCGDNDALVVARNDETKSQEVQLVAPDGTLLQTQRPPVDIGLVQWSGARFIAQASGIATGATGPGYLALSETGEWTDALKGIRTEVRLRPLDGKVVLAIMLPQIGATTFEVEGPTMYKLMDA